MTDTKPIWVRWVKLSKQEILERFGEVPTPEEIEAAARGARYVHVCEAAKPDPPTDYAVWDDIPEDSRRRWRLSMEAALKAAMAVRRR